MSEIKKNGYEKPSIKRVNLALDETLSAGCKVGVDDCNIGDPFDQLSEAGS